MISLRSPALGFIFLTPSMESTTMAIRQSAARNAKRSGKRRPRFKPVHPHAAGIDIGSRFHVAAVAADRDDEPVRTFRSFTADLHQLADWLAQVGTCDRSHGVHRRLLDSPLRDS